MPARLSQEKSVSTECVAVGARHTDAAALGGHGGQALGVWQPSTQRPG